MSEIYIIYHDVPNNYDVPEYAETLGFCNTLEDAENVCKTLRKKRYPKNALFPYAPVYTGRVYYSLIKEIKVKVREQK